MGSGGQAAVSEPEGQEVGTARVNFWRVEGADGPGLRRCDGFEGAKEQFRKPRQKLTGPALLLLGRSCPEALGRYCCCGSRGRGCKGEFLELEG